MNEGNILTNLARIITGSRHLVEHELPLHGHIRASNDYYPLVTGDVPTWSINGISFDDGETALLDFTLPQDYDETVDACALRLTEVPSADAAHTTDLGITTAQSIFRPGSAVDATASSAVAEDATASTDQLVRENVLNISGRSFQAGDHIRLTLDANNSAGTELILLGMHLIYSSCIRGYNDDDVSRNIGS